MVATSCLPEPFLSCAYTSLPGRSKPGPGGGARAGSRPARGAARAGTASPGVLAGVEVGRQVALQGGVGDLQAEAVAELLERLGRELLHLVGGVAGLEVGAQRPALDGLREDHGRLPGVLAGRGERGVDLAVVVAAAVQERQVALVQVGLVEDPAQLRGVEEALADVGAVLGGVGLELAVGRAVHLADQLLLVVVRQQPVPLAAPQDLDDVPAGAAEEALQLLDDLAVAAHRAVEALQVAVDDPGEVVELLAAGDGQRALGLGLVHLAVADERPHAAGRWCRRARARCR